MDNTSDSGNSNKTSKGHIFNHNQVSGTNVHLGDVHIHNKLGVSSEHLLKNLPVNVISASVTPRAATPYFTGRLPHLKQLHGLLSVKLSDCGLERKSVIVLGLGGCGKTQFCLKYSQLYQSDYWHVFWIDGSSIETVQAGYAEIGRFSGKGATFAAGRHWLSQIEQPWLLFLDNVDSHEIDLLDITPSGTCGHIVVTTRNSSLKMDNSTSVIQLGGMNPDEAVELLLKSAYPTGVESFVEQDYRCTANNIANRLGYLAIAIHQAGATIRQKIYTIEEYLNYFLNYRGQLKRSHKHINLDEIDVITTWEVPFGRIEARRSVAYKDAVTLVHVFAFFHNDAISESIFYALWYYRRRVHIQSPINLLPELLSVSETDLDAYKVRVRAALTVLHDYAILDFDPAAGRCNMHPVVHAWARSRMTDRTKTEYWLNVALHIQSTCGLVESRHLPAGFARSLLPHVETVLQATLELENASFMNTAERATYHEGLANICAESGQWTTAIALLDQYLGFLVKNRGSTDHLTLRTKRSLSLYHWNLFHVADAINLQEEIRQARWWHRSSLLEWRQPIHPTDVEYLVALTDLTQTLWLAGQLSLSRRAGERAVDGLTCRLGLIDPRTVNAMFYLGRTYRHIGLFDKAQALLVYALKTRKSTIGSDHVDTLLIRNEVGMSLYSQKRNLRAAESIVRNVLVIRRKVLGEEHAYTLWSINDLSKILCACNRPREAIQLLEENVDVVARTLGEEHVGMHMHKGNLARAYSLCQEWDKASECLADILPSMDKRQSSWSSTMIGHARLQIRQGKLARAESACHSVLEQVEHSKRTLKLTTLHGIITVLTMSQYRSDELQTLRKQTEVVHGLLAEIHRQRGDYEKLDELLSAHPDTLLDVLDQPFDLVV